MTLNALISAYCPALAAAPSDAYAVWTEIAETRVSRVAFGSNGDQAVALMAAHLFTLAANLGTVVGAGGAIASESEGALSRSYALPNMDTETSLKSTGYGLQFIELRNQSVIGPMNRQVNTEFPVNVFPFRNYY